ncbi:hypothetical protein [Candidatus Marinarcus aquaticus]|nr:hypothetical protein [Candidatus Marinarcus aquaticus]
METILNEYDMVVGARFGNGTIQDYVDEDNTYGLIRIEDSTCKWFLYHKEESDDLSQKLYKKVTLQNNHFIRNDFGEEIVLFDKEGSLSFEIFIKKIDEYLDDQLGELF